MMAVDEYVEGALDAEDVFPCKGCGEILEEGKAFELAGNRWHLNCFRCNTCGTLLDSDANLLLLGDGSLICNNCTYSCSACGNKIEDLAILTGDQAFCATCFRCRNCKRKIENLRYARTSQGIFCMSCHESLMARRRKKSKAAAQAKSREKESPMITDKSLPALPPNAIPPNAFSNDRVEPESDTPTELSPRPRPAYPQQDSSRNSSRPARSPERAPDVKDVGLGIPQPNYRNNRNSSIISGDMNLGDGDGFFIPVALDPSPGLTPTPKSSSETPAEPLWRPKDKDYFGAAKQGHGAAPDPQKTDSQASTPHIAFQDKGRQSSSEYDSSSQPIKPPARKLSKRNDKQIPPRASPAVEDDRPKRQLNGHKEEFKLQEAPKSKKFGNSRSNSTSSNFILENGVLGNTVPHKREQNTTPENGNLLVSGDGPTPRSSQDVRMRDEEDMRPPTEAPAVTRPELSNKPIARKEVGAGRSVNGKLTKAPPHDESVSGQLAPARPGPPEQKLSDTYMQPRPPPQPPSHGQRESVTSVAESSSPKVSPKLPRWSAGGDFSMDADMARILGTDEGSSSILRKVSNAVRHGRTASTEVGPGPNRQSHTRSVSETTRLTASPRWPKTPLHDDSVNGHAHHEISSPLATSAGHDDAAFLKRQLTNSEQRVAELERQFNAEKDLKTLNKKLLDKRKTVSVLDTQAELMIQQLEVLTTYVKRAKETKEPLDARDLEESAIKDFIQKLDRVKNAMASTIEQLHAEKDELIEQKNQAVADRDRALLEFEQLSSKNAQLADMNNDLTHQIQERFKQQIGGIDPRSPNGLGIYGPAKSNTSISMDTASLGTAGTLVNPDNEEPVLEGPTVVNMRKGQVKKFNWKKGSKTVAQNISKGINRAAGAFQQGQEPARYHQGLTGDNIGLPYNMTVAQMDSPSAYTSNGVATVIPANRIPSDGRQGFGFFSKKGGALQKQPAMANLSTPTIAEAPTTLFGSDLSERADYERRQIPSVITRCIEEVELRGMDVEGIYRKTGGNSQVKMIQEGFDKSEDFDISDPAIDITAVTSVLKQYFRKLPIPLLTFDVYDRVLESNSITNDAERCAHLRKTIGMLPPSHRDCLEFLMFHLSRVAGREKENLMSPKNIAVVFAPTIMRDHSIEREMTDTHAKNLAVQFIVENSHAIFSEM